ncbi:hypothetical protein SK128_014848 [Halocaridina rubra]|uniref:RUN domain-containing protein n=1 Tax=Halocaridina rubra TaxID=373956 RepID=A0AAN8XF44_HALRR
MNEHGGKSKPPLHHKKLLPHIKHRDSERQPRQNHVVAVRSLLSELVNTTAAILTSGPVYVWQVYGGFQRIYEAILHIFKHGCVHTDAEGSTDVWPFIVGLRVLSPVLGPSREVLKIPRPAEKWIHSSLEKLELASKIAALTADREYVEKHYHPWALFRSPRHINAVKICLKALEENSQDGLADIDPKLLVGEYCPPPGVSATGRPDLSDKYSVSESDNLISGCSGLSQIGITPKRNVSSLPTSPVGEKDWLPEFPQVKQKRELATVCSGDISGRKNSKHKPPHHPFIKRGKSEVSLKTSNKDIEHHVSQSSGNVGVDIDGASLLHRESPDGSSGSSEWPIASPVSQPVSYRRKDLPHLSTTSTSPIAKLVQGEVLTTSRTGARPKEFNNKSSKPQPASQFHIDVSDSSEPGSSISPSLIQVNYGGKHSMTSDGDASSSQETGKNGGGLETRTPQIRRRSSSGRLGSVHVESDQDSEDTIDGNLSQGSKRRRRPALSQHRSGLSVKMLIDSRNVLGPDQKKTVASEKNKVKNLTRSQSKDLTTCEELRNADIAVPNTLLEKTDYSSSHIQSTSVSVIIPDQISAKSTLGIETVSLASSAPGRVIKPSNLDLSASSKVKKKTHSRSRSDGAQELAEKLKIATSNTVPTLKTGTKLRYEMTIESQIRKRFMDDGGHSITLAADYGVSPRPQPGQSLINFLSSKDKAHAELDRENAHFNISEAVIAALMQMQFNTWQGKTDVNCDAGEESDEEIRILEARIREKRRLKRTASVAVSNDLSVSKSKSTSEPLLLIRSPSLKVESTTDYSVCESPHSSTYNSESDLLSELEEEDACEEATSCSEIAPVTVSIKVPKSDQPNVASDMTSAESVAINLLKHFSEQKLPKASELDWLVSEQEVPQKLLPLPTSVAVSPDDIGMEKESEFNLQLRGTNDWAPPRPQLILSLHTNTKRSLLMGMQRWRCAGCGMRVSESLSRHFRLCHYLGRYFCTTCHKNQTALIPAKILHKWDFKHYPVASFSYELIERMKIDPLINVGALNPRLYRKCRHLHQTHIYRLQLYHTLPYINTCSRAQSEKFTLGKLPLHWASDPHVYSLDDLEAIRAGQVVCSIKDVTMICIRHISICEVCLGRGFICEICCRGEAIFPFQLDSTSLCEICSACFHAGCFSPSRCPRCIRRESRRLSHDLLIESEDLEMSIEKLS